MIWDFGTYNERGCLADESREERERRALSALEKGHLTFVLNGRRLKGEFSLVRLKEDRSWLLIKKRDKHMQNLDITTEDSSIVTGRSMQEIAAEAEQRGEVWSASVAEKR